MIVLGLETATAVCSVGLVAGERRFVRTIREDRVHSEKLLTLVAGVLQDAGATMDDVEGVAVSGGPGSFTGLRIGVSAAKGLVAPRGRAFVGIPTMAGAVASARLAGRFTDGGMVVMDARQGEWYVGECDRAGNLGAVSIQHDAAVRTRMPGRDVLTDRPDLFGGSEKVGDLLDHLRGDSIAHLGRERLRRGERDDVTMFEPTYLKEFVVRTPQPRGR